MYFVMLTSSLSGCTYSIEANPERPQFLTFDDGDPAGPRMVRGGVADELTEAEAITLSRKHGKEFINFSKIQRFAEAHARRLDVRAPVRPRLDGAIVVPGSRIDSEHDEVKPGQPAVI